MAGADVVVAGADVTGADVAWMIGASELDLPTGDNKEHYHIREFRILYIFTFSFL